MSGSQVAKIYGALFELFDFGSATMVFEENSYLKPKLIKCSIPNTLATKSRSSVSSSVIVDIFYYENTKK